MGKLLTDKLKAKFAHLPAKKPKSRRTVADSRGQKMCTKKLAPGLTASEACKRRIG